MKKILKIVLYTIIIGFIFVTGYVVYLCSRPIYFVYAVIPPADGGRSEWKEVYKSNSHDQTWERYEYLNRHKEEGVKYYIFFDEETGNSVIPF